MDDSDSDLLDRFVEQRDQAAFAALVDRHSPLVLGVCRRVLEDLHDAEDAAQAAFLVLARHAPRLDRRPPLGPWLYRVALNLARSALRERRSRERVHQEVAAMPQRTTSTTGPAAGFDAEIDAALATLPERERSAITLFHLQGRPAEEVAKLVGQPVGTVYVWLSRGRERLRLQLTRRGVGVSAALLLSALGGLCAGEAPAGFSAATAGAAAAFLGATAAGAAGAVTPAAALASQGIKTMGMISAIKTSLIAAGLAVALGGAGWIAAAEGAGGAKKPSTVLGAPTFVPTPEVPVGWRGDGSGRYPGATPPTAWSRKRSGAGYETKGILWASPLPGAGVSSPIVVGQRIVVTCDFTDVVCLDKASGRILWIRSNLEFEALSDDERKSMPAIAEKLEPLRLELAKANDAAMEALNAQLAGAATADYHLPPALVRKRQIEKQIGDAQQAIDKKKFDRYWAQSGYGFCTETPASDGKHVCAFFATGVAAGYDLDGNRLWIAKGSYGGEEKGHYSSPLLAGKQFVVWGEPEIRGYDVESGKVLWRNPAKGSNCGSLYRIQLGNELVVGLQSSCFTRLRDGQTIWKAGILDFSFTSAIAEGDMIYFWTAGPPANNKDFKAFKIPASTDGGQVTAKLTFKKADWAADELTGKFDKGDINASPIYVDGLIYHLYPGGGLLVHDAATGDIVYRKVLPMKPRVEYWGYGGASACPTLAGKYIYLLDNQGTTVVIQPGRKYQEVAVNRIEEVIDGKGQDQNLATPFFEGARMYYRTPGHLYCIGDK